MAKTVVFAVPTYSQRPSFHFDRSSLLTQDLCKSAGWNQSWNFRPGDPYISKCRSIMATEFLVEHPSATKFVFFDDDVGWDANAIVRNLERDEDVIAGVYPKKEFAEVKEKLYRADGSEVPAGTLLRKDPEVWPVELLFDKDTMLPIRRDHLVLAALVPTGFLIMSRNVLEKCSEQSGIYIQPDTRKGNFEVFDLFRNGFIPDQEKSRRGKWWGEDFFFSFMVRQLGFDIWVDPDIDFSHSGEYTWRGNFSRYLAVMESRLKKAA